MNRILIAFAIVLWSFAASAQQGPVPSLLGPGGSSLSGTLPVAGSNMTFSVTTAGNDNNPCTVALPCLTLQRAVNMTNGYNWSNQYFPTINIANGTYAAVQIVLPALVNCSNGGVIVGNTTTPTSVSLNDAGTDYTLTVSTNSIWTVNGISFGGTYGGFDVKTFAVLNMNKINWGGALAQIGLLAEPLAAVYVSSALVQAGTLSISASTMGIWLFSRGLVVMDNVAITVTNPITFATFFVALDATTSFLAFDGTTITNGSNVTATSNGLIMSNGPFLEANSNTKVDSVLLVRGNFPGGNVSIDGWSIFQPDNSTPYSSIFAFNAATSSITVKGAGSFSPTFNLDDTHALGINWSFGNALNFFFMTNISSGSFQVPFAIGNSAFNLASIPLTWNSGTQAAPFAASDTGLSRTGAAALALGNGTAGDFTGTLKLAHLTATALANTATTSAVCYNTGTGVLTYDGTVGTCTVSDERLKNMGARIPDALDKLLRINGVYGTWKDPAMGSGRQIFIGAQTVEGVFPELVQTDADGKKSLDYQRLTAPIIEALRELKADNDNMKAELKKLKAAGRR